MPSRSNITYVDPEVLEKVESRIQEILRQTRALAILLIDRSGLVLAAAGDPPLHPNQMGAVAAGVFSAMSTMIKASRAEEFTVYLRENHANFQFQHVDTGVFLCAFYADARDEELVRAGMKELSQYARNSITAEQTSEGRMDSELFIEEKLNELFSQ